MAVMTANCDRAFIVSAENAERFKAQTKNETLAKKIDSITSRLGKDLNIEDETKLYARE